MDDFNPKKDETTRQSQFLLTQLIILTLLIIGLVLLVAVYPQLKLPFRAQAQVTQRTLIPSATPSLTLTPSLTPTPTRTLRYTLTPTITLTPTPSETPTLTPTPTGLPTLAPASPLNDNTKYSLVEWGAEEADYLARYMQDYPNTLSETARGEADAGYWAAFDYAVKALDEALLRFPEAEQAGAWHWMLALNLERSGNRRSAEVFGGLVAGALNRGEVELEGLEGWFHAHAPEDQLYQVELKPPEGFESSRLLQIEGAGSAFLWLLGKSGAFQAFPLAAHLDSANPIAYRALLSDLTGDGNDELVIFPQEAQNSYEMAPPQVFDLSQFPQHPLLLRPGEDGFTLGIEFQNNWSIQPGASGGEQTEASQAANDLVFEVRAFDVCPLSVQWVYHWDGAYFARQQESYSVTPQAGTLSLCRYLVDQAAEYWGPQAAGDLAEQLLPNWPPELKEDGTPFASDAKDELRFRLGVYRALSGEVEQAVAALQGIVDAPTVSGSSWAAPAAAFLSRYQAQAGEKGLYLACQETALCKPAQALQRLSALLPPDSNENPLALLAAYGIFPVAAGYSDFDQDGASERWFTIRHRPLERLEYWILATTPEGARALRLGFVEENKPFIFHEEQEGVPVAQVDQLRFKFSRQPETYAPLAQPVEKINTVETFLKKKVETAEAALFKGEPPAPVQQDLKTVPASLCPRSYECGHYWYLLGLAAELAGDERPAVDAYLTLWRQLVRSPYTIFARFKLEGIGVPALVEATLTPSPSASATITPIGLATATPTPTPSETPGEPYPYPYPYPIATDTPFVYPYPYP